MDIKLTEILGKKEGEIFSLQSKHNVYDFKIENNQLLLFSKFESNWIDNVTLNWVLSLKEVEGDYALVLVDELGAFLGLKRENDGYLYQSVDTGEFSFGNIHNWENYKYTFTNSYLKNLLEENPHLKDITYIKQLLKF